MSDRRDRPTTMAHDPRIDLFDLVACLARAMDLVSPAVANHHIRVAYIAMRLGMELSLPANEQRDLAIAGALHDSGALSLKERLAALEFELTSPQSHAEIGYSLLMAFQPLAHVAKIVRYHHTPWRDTTGFVNRPEDVHTTGPRHGSTNERAGSPADGSEGGSGSGSTTVHGGVPLSSHVLHLADRVAVLVRENDEILAQANQIRETLLARAGTMFAPDPVEAFLNLADKEYFWFDIALMPPSEMMSLLARAWTEKAAEGREAGGPPCAGELPCAEPAGVLLDLEGLIGLAGLFRRIIDFRSPFTATHSAGVAATASHLARLAGFSDTACKTMMVAGYLHDIGKLAVPSEILEKPGRLTEHEFNIIKQHAFYSYRIMESLPALELVNTWASLHHERLDGRGYPFHHSGRELSLGSRIMSVADVFTALTEQRPYRRAMEPSNALVLIQELASGSGLDPGVVSLLATHLDEVDADRRDAQANAGLDYEATTAAAANPRV